MAESPRSEFSVASRVWPFEGVDGASAARRGIRIDIDEEHRKASELWNQVEAELNKRLKLSASAESTPSISRNYLAGAEQSSDGPKRKRAAPGANAATAGVSPSSGKSSTPQPNQTLALSASSGSIPRFTALNCTISSALKTVDGGSVVPSERDLRIQAARDTSFDHRSQQMRIRSHESGLHQKSLDRRKLRMKINDLCAEVARRQELQRHQDRMRKFRERRERQGKGPAALLGDHRDDALGLERSTDQLDEQVKEFPSPRRSFILSNLTPADLDLLRRETRFYFEGVLQEATDTESAIGVEHLIDFFVPPPTEKNIPVEEYARKLRKQLAPAPSERNDAAMSHAPSATLSTFDATIAPAGPITLMPCMGSKKAVRNDMASPTLQRVREAVQRRDAADAKLLRDRKERLEQREEQNAMKSQEHRAEMQFQTAQRQEEHRLRLEEAEQRRTIQRNDESERLLTLDAQLHEQHIKSELKAELAIERKRDAAMRNVAAWNEKALRAERNVRRAEVAHMQAAERDWDAYVTRIWKIGMDKHAAMSKVTDNVGKQLQGSLVRKLAEQQKRESAALMQEIEEKQAAAAARRNEINGCRYNFLEKAFGTEAVGMDVKNQLHPVDRRTDTWTKNAAAWAREKQSFSMPDLRGTS